MRHLPFLLVAFPLMVAFILPLSDLVSPHHRKGVLCLFIAGQSALVFMLLKNWSALPFEYLMGGWPIGTGISLHLDRMSAVFVSLVTVLGIMAVLYSFDRITHNQGKYYVLILLMTAGLIGAMVTGDLFNLYVFNEIVAITSYALVAFERRVSALEAAFKYLLYGALSGVFFLLAVVLFYFGTGSLNMMVISERMSSLSPRVLTAVTGLLLVAFSVKMGLVPFHTWLSDAHASAPSPVSAMLSGAVINLGGYSAIRVFYFMYGPELSHSLGVNCVLLTAGIVSVLLGHMMAAAQSESKRLLAYSSIAQMGYVAIALGIGSSLAISVAVIYAMIHGVLKGGLFLAVGSLTHEAGSRDIVALSGASHRWTTSCITLAGLILGIAGSPPLAGFVGKSVLVRALLVDGSWLALTVVLVGTAISAYYYFRFAFILFTPFSDESAICPVDFVAEGKLGLASHLPVFLLLSVALLIGIAPAFIEVDWAWITGLAAR